MTRPLQYSSSYYVEYDSDDVENNNPRHKADNSTLPKRSTRDKKVNPRYFDGTYDTSRYDTNG